MVPALGSKWPEISRKTWQAFSYGKKKTENGHSRCVCTDAAERVFKFDLTFLNENKHENKGKIELLVRYHCGKPMKPSEKFKTAPSARIQNKYTAKRT